MNKVAAFYQFVRIGQPSALRDEIQAQCEALGLFGTVLVSVEGINGTLAGPPAGIDAFVAGFGFPGMEVKFSSAGAAHFDRLKVRVKREIITFGWTLDEATPVGQHVPAEAWNALLEEPGVVLVDTRKREEIGYGTFEGAMDPGIHSFTAFKRFVETALKGREKQKIAMFCTGGIRCEKASAYLLEQGFSEVFQLKGGILRYLETVPAAQSRFKGDCFVFDQRVALGHGLAIKTPKVHPNFLDTARGTIAE